MSDLWDYKWVLITTTLMLRQDALSVSQLRPMNSMFMIAVTLMTYAAPVMDKGNLSLHIYVNIPKCVEVVAHDQMSLFYVCF